MAMKARPMSLSEEEVAAMAGTGRLATAVRRLLAETKVRRPKEPAGAKKQAPPKLSRADIAALRAGRASSALRKKVFGDPPANAAQPTEYPTKQAPTQLPPSHRASTKRKSV